MKIELICRKCEGKRFTKRSSRFRVGGDWQQSVTFECRKCKAWIDIVYTNLRYIKGQLNAQESK